jgi:hypothetical protein
LRGVPRPVVDHAAVLAAYAAGHGIVEVTRITGASIPTVQRLVRKAGIHRPRAAGASHPLRLAEPERRCRECGIVKPTTRFEVLRRAALSRVCVDCSGNFELQAELRKTAPRECNYCRAVLPPAEFYKPDEHTCRRCHQQKAKAWRDNHRPELKAYGLRWQRENKARVRAAVERRRARKNGAQAVDLTAGEWTAILAEHNHCCAYCGVSGARLEKEHVVPISRGGSHTKSNVVPACRSCNASKNHRTVEEWRAGVVVPRKAG